MVKKMISRLLVSAMLIVFIAACSQKSEYTSAIPADASAVASINLKSLADKSGLKDKENEAAKQKMIEALKSGTTAATFQQLEKVLNIPKRRERVGNRCGRTRLRLHLSFFPIRILSYQNARHR